MAGLLCAPLSAKDFRFGNLEGLLDTTIAYGVLVRTEDADDDLIAISSGGNADGANGDDGAQNYDTGIVSNMVRITEELSLRHGNVGAYVRGYAFYDYENQDQSRERTNLSDSTKDIVGRDADLLENYLVAHGHVAGVPVLARLGDQIINWGQTIFIRDGVDVINPVDLVAALQPASNAKDIFVPQGMLWGAANITENYAIEGYYQYEWKKARIPPVGSYFSANDAIGDDGTNFIILGAGQVSDLGTDLDSFFSLPTGTLGFDENYLKIPGLGSDRPSDGGQYGITLRTVLPGVTATTLGVHYIRYHSRLPIISGLTADQQAIDETSSEAVAARAAQLEPIYIDEGLSPEEAEQEALATAESLTLSGYTNSAGYFATYPEDIDMVGLTFNTATRRGGVLLSGEISHHMDHPFQIDVDAVVNGVLSPIEYDPNIGDGVLGEFGASEVVKGFTRLDKTQTTFGAGKLISGRRIRASQIFLSGDVAWVHVHDLPDRTKLPLTGAGKPTEDSWGYRLIGQLSYNNVFGGLNLSPRVVFTHDVDGVTPAPFGTFTEDRMSLSFGVGATYIRAWSADLSYTNFFNAGSDNLLNDRDFVKLRISYSF
jgi:hypothetical protein